jgi:peptidoglycan/LPS O-acetylase OafA/YrhL
MIESDTPSPHLRYRPEIDGLRACAVLGVVFFHAFPRWVSGGYVGVDVFFALSGYLITSVILKDLIQARFSFREFYARRARRLFPSLILVLAACLIAGSLLMTAPEFGQLGKHVLSSVTFTSNFIFRREAGYFDAAASLKPLLHLWSLGIEEQFYIVWPLALFFLWKKPNTIVPFLAVVAIASFAFSIYLTRREPVAAFFLPLPRAWELALGAALAMVEQARIKTNSPTRRWPDRPGTLLAAIGLLLVIASVIAIPADAAFPGWWALIPTFGTLLVISAGPGAWTNRHVLASRGFVEIGRISYPIYLWHWPLLSFAKLFENETPSRGTRVGLVLLAFPLAKLTHELIEKRALSKFAGRDRIPRILSAKATAAMMSLLGIVGFAAYLGQGFPSRFPGETVAADNAWPEWHSSAYSTDTLARRLFEGAFAPDRDFFTNAAAISRRIGVFIGDSHANAFFVGAADDSILRPAMMNIGRGSCLPLLNVDSFASRGSLQCQPLMDNAIRWAAKSAKVRVVFLSGFFDQYLDGRIGIGVVGASESSRRTGRADTTLLNGLERTAAFLIRRGKIVVIVADEPEMSFHVFDCLSRRVAMRPHRADCTISYANYLQSSRTARTIIDSVRARNPDVVLFDASASLCDSAKCRAIIGHRLLYRNDGNHLNLAGAKLVGADLRRLAGRLDLDGY